MENLQKRMEELQRQYMKEKENLRVDLVSTLLNARKMMKQQEMAGTGQESGAGLEDDMMVSPQILQLQQQKQMIQQQIDEHIRSEQRAAVQAQLEQEAGLASHAQFQQHQYLNTVFSPPPGPPRVTPNLLPSHAPHHANSSSPFQPVPTRYAYVSAGQPQLLNINGQQVQVVAMPGQLPGHHLAGHHPAPQLTAVAPQYYSVPQQEPAPPSLHLRPDSFPSARFSPRTVELEAGEELEQGSVVSEPARPPVLDATKRDSFSDSGAEGSGHNTPTRGRTVTEGLLRFVQDSSVSRVVPQHPAQPSPAQPGSAFPGGLQLAWPGPAPPPNTGRQSVPLIPQPSRGAEQEQPRHVPVIQAVGGAAPVPVIQQNWPPYPGPGHTYPAYPGRAGEVSTIRQPIMSSSAQPSNYTVLPGYNTIQAVPQLMMLPGGGVLQGGAAVPGYPPTIPHYAPGPPLYQPAAIVANPAVVRPESVAGAAAELEETGEKNVC